MSPPWVVTAAVMTFNRKFGHVMSLVLLRLLLLQATKIDELFKKADQAMMQQSGSNNAVRRLDLETFPNYVSLPPSLRQRSDGARRGLRVRVSQWPKGGGCFYDMMLQAD